MSVESFKTLSEANDLFNAGKSAEALRVLKPIVPEMSNNYWTNFLIAKILEDMNLEEGAKIYFNIAINTNDPARIGAVAHLVKMQMKKGNLESAALLDDVIAAEDLAGQNKYYIHNIYFMRAMSSILESNYAAAEKFLQLAYNAVSYMPIEFDFNIPLIREHLRGADLSSWSYLSYLRYRYLEDNHFINYTDELNKMDDDTFVVEIGAMDGVRFDALREPITTRGWNALLLEPLPDMFSQLKLNYSQYSNVICCNAAITNTPGPVKMYRVPTSAVKHGTSEEYVAGISSMHKTFLIENSGDYVVEEEVEGVTFDQIAKRYSLSKIDVLQIDTEGHDLIVLENVCISRWKIKIIQIEILNLMPPDRLKVLHLLFENGYRCHFDGSDVTAVLKHA